MSSIRSYSISLPVAAALVIASPAMAQLLTDHIWIGGTGSQQWQVNTNWDQGMFPNDPGRADADVAAIDPVIGANLSVNLPADLNVSVGATDITIAALTLGSTSSPIATNITTGGGRLVFENFEQNDNSNPDNVICAFNCGAALITSQGAMGATNTITAAVGINDVIEIAGTRGLTLAGGLQEIGTGEDVRALTPGLTVFVTGNISTLDMPANPNEDDVPLSLNSGAMSQGTIDVSGMISGGGRVRYGTTVSAPTLPFGSVIVRGNNTYSGRTIISRGNLVLGHDNALGTADVKQEGPSAGSLQTGYNILSDNDDRVISNDLIIGQWQTVKGEHSLEWAGIVYQDNARGWINMLPNGKTLTLSGGHFPNHTEEMPPAPGRNLTLDGTGRTVITGGLHDEWSAMTETIDAGNFTGSYRFRGTGATIISGGNSTYRGDTIVQGSNVHFATNADYGNTARIDSTGGAVGVDAGVVNNAAFLGLLNSAAAPAMDAANNPVVWDRGGLMLGTAEYGMNLNFTSGPLANAANMTLAAHESGSAFTGTITPASSTYRLGGGSGALTLPNANQLTGSNGVLVANGGEVRLTATNNYTGATRILGAYQTTLADAAQNDTINFNDGNNIPNDQQYVGTTLTASTLANGGSSSSIGSSSNAASNLFIQRSTLKYTGDAVNTDRLFTIGTGGATINASGTGPVHFTNPGLLGVDVAEQRTGNANAFATGNTTNDRGTIRNLSSTEDLQPGMPIMTPGLPLTGSSAGIPANTVITRIISATDVGISNPVGDFAFNNNTAITFGPAPERKLTLSGTNGGDNTLAAIIPNASDGGVVGLTKTGTGKWILTGNNTYTGSTTVNEGTLLVNGNHSGSGVTSIGSGGLFGGTGSLGGNLVLEEGATFVSQFVSGMIDPLAVAGNIDLSALANTLTVTGTGTGTNWVIATYSGTLNGTFENISTGFTVDYGTGSNSQITLMAGTIGVAGDYNQDGTVDAADYVVWRNSLGAASLPNEGGVSPGVVDAADYDFWRSRFGATSGAGAAFGTLAVPEPSCASLVSSAILGLLGLSRFTSRRGRKAPRYS